MTLPTIFLLGVSLGILIGAAIAITGYRRGLRHRAHSAEQIVDIVRTTMDFHSRRTPGQ